MTEYEKREKVIKGLQICKEDSKLCFGESECGYQSYFPRCWITLAGDAFALLKAQEPVKPLRTNIGSVRENYLCGECGGSFFRNKVNFCPWCGKAVKWGE